MDLLPVETALERVLEGTVPSKPESVTITDAGGRVLAEPVVSRRMQPSFDASAMDGYAFRSTNASVGARLRLVGEAAAGRRFERVLQGGEAIRIFTGAPLPSGADTVLPQEEANVEGGSLVIGAISQGGQHVRLAGCDFGIGEPLLAPGRRIGARELAVIASANLDVISVRHKPIVAILSIGDELVQPGPTLGPDQTIATNAFAIGEMARNAGADVSDLGIVSDKVGNVTAAATTAASFADVLVTIGGASVGDHDVARPGLAAAGMELDFWRIAMRPGKPLVFGRLGEMAVLGLPGNPVSSFVCGVIFLRPLVTAMLGTSAASDETPAVLGAELPANGPRTHYLRASVIDNPHGLPRVVPLPQQDSSLLGVLARADCLLIHPGNADRSEAGSICSIIRL